MRSIITAVLLCSLRLALADSSCPEDYDLPYTCPSSGTYNVCEGDSLTSNIIFRCIDGCPTPGNCNDNLANVPPYGVKQGAYCWQSSSTTGDAQCTIDCVKVTAANGTSFYPLGCSFQSDANGNLASTSISVAAGPTATAAPTQSTSATPSQTNAAVRPALQPETWGGLLGMAFLVLA